MFRFACGLYKNDDSIMPAYYRKMTNEDILASLLANVTWKLQQLHQAGNLIWVILLKFIL